MLKNMSTNVDHKTMDKKLLLKTIKSRVRKDFSQSYEEYLNPIKYNACLDIAEMISYANQFIGFCSDGQYLRRCLEYLSIVVQNRKCNVYNLRPNNRKKVKKSSRPGRTRKL